MPTKLYCIFFIWICSACYQPCLPSIATDAVIQECNPQLQDTPPPPPAPPLCNSDLTKTAKQKLSTFKLQTTRKYDDFCCIFIGDYTMNIKEFYSFLNFSQMRWNVYQTKEATATHSSDNKKLTWDNCLISVFCLNIFVKL